MSLRDMMDQFSKSSFYNVKADEYHIILYLNKFFVNISFIRKIKNNDYVNRFFNN